MTHADPPRPTRMHFPHRMKLHGSKAFARVYGARVRAVAGHLTVFAIPNDRPYNRIGLSVPRAGGTAIRRNAIKRRLREAFRLIQHNLPTGYDLAVRVRSHEPRCIEEYQASLRETVEQLHRTWRKRQPTTSD